VVVLAVPPLCAARLLEPFAAEAAAAMGGLGARSSLTVSLAYRRDAVAHPLDATGFVVPPDTPATGGFAACTFTSAKFPGRAPADGALLRVFFRPDPAGIDRDTDDTWAARAHAVLAPTLGLATGPLHTWVSRWPRALPEHGPAYADAVMRCEELLGAHPGLLLAGSAVHGPGVEGAVHSGATVVQRFQS
jgi:oxygen-dependent protoporphyrinogen oxidase